MTTIMTKKVEDLRNIHKNQEIWIIGSGASLNDFPTDFFDDKLSITLNGAIYKYPDCTYWHGHHEPWREYFRDERPDLLPKCIISYPFPGLFAHGTVTDPVEFFGELTSIPYWLYFRDSTVVDKETYRIPISEIINKKDTVAFRCTQTVLHSAMEIAFLMGANKITLAGCENKKFEKSNSHAEIGIPYPWNADWSNKPLILQATQWVAEIFNEHGVDTQRYYNANTDFYKKGYEMIAKNAIEFKRIKGITMNKKFTFHYLSMPHLPVTKEYCHCAFTQKIHKLTCMILDKGHTVYLYGVDHTDIEHENLHFVPCVTLSDVRKEWGDGDNRFELGYDISTGFRHDLNKPITECQKKFRENAIENINLNKKPDHFLLLSQGSYHKYIADNVGLYLTLEPGIGYRGSYCKFRAFESSYIQNFTYGSENPRQSINGRYHDRVIPNYFETNLFNFNDKPEDYLCYLGRIIPRKGISTAMKVADVLGMKLKVAGQGSLNDISYKCKNIEFIGIVDDKQRNELLKNAKVLFLPTFYLEPFGGTSIEANFCGTPSITTNFGVFPETIINGLNGYRCDTLQDFVDNTKKAFDLDRKKIREYAINNFSTEVINEQFEKWWQDLYQLYLSTTNKNIKGWHYIKDN